MASVPAAAPALTVLSVQSVIMSASLLLVADMGRQAGAAVVLVGGFGDSTCDGVDGLAERAVLCWLRQRSVPVGAGDNIRF